MRFDVIASIEACYSPARDERSWLAAIGATMEPLDRGLGGVAMTYDARDPARIAIGELVRFGDGPDVSGLVRAFHQVASPDLIRAMYWRPPPFGSVVEHLAGQDPGVVESVLGALAAMAYSSIYAVHGSEPDHRGFFAGVAAPRAWKPAPRTVHQLTRLAAHYATAYRLRNALGAPATPESGQTEAILTPSGRIAEARGDARPERARASLGEAVRRVERARGQARRASPEEAVDLWRGLVNGSWSLVDHVESDGRRYVLAVRNPPGVRDPRALGPRERDVAGLAAMGRSNKWIGYALGIAPSTVAGHLASAARKLGFWSRTELILGLSSGDQRAPNDPTR